MPTKNDTKQAVAEATPASTAIAAFGDNRPAHLAELEDKSGKRRGFDEMESKDITIPRLGLCQSNTKQRMRSESNYIPGLEEGHFFNTLNGTNYGSSVDVVPLFFYKSRIRFKDLEQGGGILCQAPDGKSCQENHGGPCLHDKWGANGEPPECTEFFNYPCFVVGQDGRFAASSLVVVSLKSTGIKAARGWNSMMRIRKSDMFSGIWRLSSYGTQNAAKQPYYAWKVDASPINGSWLDKENYIAAGIQYEGVYEGIRSGTMKVDTSELNEEQGTGQDDAPEM